MEKHITTITYPEDYDGLCVGIGGCLKHIGKEESHLKKQHVITARKKQTSTL